jgi:2-dehydrotetronate isomerase
MPRFAANLSMMFTEHPFLERFSAAAASGFQAIEFLFPYDFQPKALQKELDSNQLRQVLFNLPPGDFAAGERGIAVLPDRQSEFKESVQRALEYAVTLRCQRLHVMAGNCSGADRRQLRKTFLKNLEFALEKVSDSGITLLIEPLNQYDAPDYFLNSFDLAIQILTDIKSANLKIQLDWYHAQNMQGDLTRLTERLFPHIGHIQLAGVPERQEPDLGEVNYPYLFNLVDQLGYEGWIGCEYRPAARTEEGLGWRPWKPEASHLTRAERVDFPKALE